MGFRADKPRGFVKAQPDLCPRKRQLCVAIRIRGCTTYTTIQPYNRHNYPRGPKGFLRLTGAEREKAR